MELNQLLLDVDWYHWVILGFVLIAAELFFPVYVFVWFACGAFVVALLMVILQDVQFLAQVLIWVAVSALMALLWFRLFKPYRRKTMVHMASARAIGQIGVLLADVGPRRKSSVRFQAPLLGQEVWDCIADQALPAGSQVSVAGLAGNSLKVTSAS